MKKLKIILCAIIVSFWFTSIESCDNSNKNVNESITTGEMGNKLQEQLTPIIEKVMNSHGIPGLSIGVVYDNQIVYAKGFGYKDFIKKNPVDISTIFHMASISKTFVATGIMQLVEQGKINLDSTLVSYLPYFKMQDGDYDKITIRQMLGHISGMPNSNSYEWDKPQYDEGAIERFVRSLSTQSMELKPGEKFRYSNIAFEVLGDVIAKVSGKSFCDYQKEHILIPSGMTESSFLKTELLPENWALPHEMGIEPFTLNIYPYNRRHAPSSTLHASAYEMCNWAITNLNKGNFKENKVLKPSSYSELWNPWVNIEEGQLSKYRIGLSWFIGDYKGNKTVGHGGSDEGFQTNLILLPEKSIAVIVMANTLPAPVEEISNTAIDILLGEEIAQIKPLASIPAWKVLNEKGLDEAVAFWNNLKSNNLEQYDFGIQQFFNLYFTTLYGTEEDAKNIAKFCLKVLSTEEVLYLTEILKYAKSEHPENKIVDGILEILKGE